MSAQHTVEKIGGTSMTRFGELMDNILIAGRSGPALYQRVFVVSAYGGITNLLLEDKKSGAPGVFAHFAAGNSAWVEKLEGVRAALKDLNHGFASLGLDLDAADAFVDERIDGVRDCLRDLMRVRSYGHLRNEDFLPASQEMLSAIGEAHSAFNSVLILRTRGVNARFVDLTYWKDTGMHSLDAAVLGPFATIDFATELPIVTGYVKCDVGIMSQYSRGYSEITFAKVAVLTGAREGIIHKEFHLSTGDPKLMGPERVAIIGNTNFDIADEMSDMNMEAIHSKAAREMQQRNIPIRVKNAFDPRHPGTMIERGFRSPQPKVDMICGRDDMAALHVYDPEMVGRSGYDRDLLDVLYAHNISYIAKNTSANTITHYVPDRQGSVAPCIDALRKRLPGAEVSTNPVAIVSVLGTNMEDTGLLSRAVSALAAEGIAVQGINQSPKRLSLQFVVAREVFAKTQRSLHRALVEDGAAPRS